MTKHNYLNTCKNCKRFSKVNTKDIYGECSALIFSETIDDANVDIVIDNPYGDNWCSTILVSENFGCLKFQH
jgi:hypothetical protein